MKTKLLKTFITMTKYAFYCVILQSSLCSFALPHISGAQSKKLSEIDINVNFYKATLAEVFVELEKETEFTFAYLLEDIPDAEITLPKGRKSLEQILLSIAEQAKVSFRRVNGTIHAKKLERNEDPVKEILDKIEVTGKVLDEAGQPLPGASILEKGTTNGTITDIDGNFSVSVDEGATLVVSFVGYLTRELRAEAQPLTIQLEPDVTSLNEVVVVGYGTIKKSDVTGAISSVKSEDLTNVVTPNPTEALQGRVSGVTVTKSSGSPGSGVDVVIRGIGSFGNNQPLYIVDGVQADPYFIDPNNIESIEVLKDVASSAIYGTRAANGVVLITTKEGKTGKPTIDLSSSISLNTVREEMNLLDADGYVNVHRQMYENAGASLPQYIQNPSEVNTDWIDETHKQGVLNLHNLRISGAGENVDYSISGNLADETGILIGSEFTKKGVNANVGFTKDKLKVNSSLNYTETRREDYKFSIRETYFISPLIPVYDDSKFSGYGYRDGDLPDHRNPIGEDALIDSFTKLKYFLGNISFDYEIIKGLNAKASFALSNLANYSYAFHPPFKVRDIDDNPQNEYSFVSEYNSEFRRLNQEYTLNYAFELGRNSFSVLAGYQRINEPFKETYVQAEGYKLDENGDRIPASILDPGFNTLNAFGDGTYSGSGTNAEYSLVSQFGRINYAYDGKYLFQASIRRDGSSKFGKNNKYGVFPSLALGWKITDEAFMANQNIFDFLKLRYSWGQAGNDSALGYYDYVALISQGKSQNDGGYVFGDPQTSYVGSIARDLQNDNLQWETNVSSNLGIDFASLGNQITGAINYYQSTTQDLLITKEVSPSAGVNNPVINVGEFENSGFEFEIGYRNSRGEFKYNAFATFTTISSEVTQLSNESQVLYGEGLLFGSDHFVNQTKVGYEPGAYFLPVADGIFQSQEEVNAHSVDGNLIQPNAAPGDIRFVDQNGDGVINSDDETYQGTAIPQYEYSLNLSASYRGFDLNLFFQGVGGNKIYNGNDFRLMSMETGRNYRAETLKAWTPQNTNTDVPRAVLGDPNKNNRASTRFLEDGDYFRIKTIQVGYSLPKEILDAVSLNKVRLYVTGQNLFTFTKYNGLDPEVGGNILSRGIDRNLYPKYKSMIFGLQVQF